MGSGVSKIFETDWNIVVNLGIKCNTLNISRSAKVRYYSSPFDNMDTVEGLVDCAKLMADGFDGYFDDINIESNSISPTLVDLTLRQSLEL